MKSSKKLILGITLCTSVLTLSAISFSSGNGNTLVFGAQDTRTCQWNHYDAVLPTTTSHGSHEFWACCTHPGEHSLTKPTTGTIKHIGAFEGYDFAGLSSSDDRYLPVLEEVTNLDAVSPITFSDLGNISDTTTEVTDSHVFGRYDFDGKKAIDLWIDYSYQVVGGDSHFFVYLFNQYDEAGARIRIQNNRAEDDGINMALVWTANNIGANSNYPTAPTTTYYFPRATGVKSSTENTFHIAAWCINETNQTWRIQYTLGVKGETQYNLSLNPEDRTNTPLYFDIELGADYFANGLNDLVRFSKTDLATPIIGDTTPENTGGKLVLKDQAGNTLGKWTNPGTANLPNLSKAGHTFIGWFDLNGNKVRNGDSITTTTVVYPKFVETQEHMFNPSDAENNAYGTKNGWYNSNQISGEIGYRLPVENVTNRYDLYFIYQCTSVFGADNYAVFGLPYEMVDAQTRVHFRLNEMNEGNLKGYVFGSATSLGNAGQAGTEFRSGQIRPNSNTPLLIHMAFEVDSSNNATLTVDITNLASDVTYTVTRSFTFNNPSLYSINNKDRNMFAMIAPSGCSYRITDAF